MSSTNESSSQKIKKRKCTINDVYIQSPDRLEAHPVLVSYRTPRPHNCSLSARLLREPYTRKERPGHRYQSNLTITADDGREYVGQNTITNTGPDDEIILIGALDKTTGLMRLVQAEKFIVSKKLDRNAELMLKPTSENMPDANINVAFGTKKSLQKHRVFMQEKERQSVKILPAIESATEAMHGGLRPQTSGEGDGYSYMLPPCNDEANTALEVYNMEDIVNDGVLECLIDQANEMTEDPDSVDLSPLGLMSLSSARIEPDEDVRLRHTCATLYMQLLNKIFSSEKPDLSYIDPVVAKCLNTNYKTKLKFIPTNFQDKALAHLLILAMIVNRCKLPLTVILTSITINKPRLLTFMRVLRMQVKKNDAVLQLPLPDLETERRFGSKLSLNKKSKR